MASHGLTKRRGFKPRPDVCHTQPNPGRCEPPPPPPAEVSCSIYKDEEEQYYVDEEYTLVTDCCNEAYDTELILEPEVAASVGEIDDVEDINNCIQGANTLWTAPSEPGPVTFTLRCVYPDGSEGNATLVTDVAEENGNDD